LRRLFNRETVFSSTNAVWNTGYLHAKDCGHSHSTCKNQPMLSVMACRLLGRLRQEGNLNLGVRDQFVQCRVTLSLKNTHTQLKVNERLKNKT
jgi:hypothetical protein